jgi:uncharacterized membrane protein YbhN (UPF0104 family)
MLTSLAVIAGVALIAVTHREETRQFWRDLRSLSPIAVATALVLILAQVTLQALRMWAIAPADAGLRVIRAGYIFAVGDWTNIFIPVRGGDALKVVLLTRPENGHQISLAKATGALLADKVSDVGTLLLLCVATGLTSLLVVKTRATLSLRGMVIAAAAVAVLVFIVTRRGPRQWLAARRVGLRDIGEGLSSLKSPLRIAVSVSCSVAARFAEVLALARLCAAVGFVISLPQVLLALVIVNVSISVPVSVANLGVFEAGLAYGLMRAGIPLPAAVLVATTHHMLELLGITLSAAGYTLAFQATKRGEAAAAP